MEARKTIVTLAAIIVLLPSLTYGSDYVEGEIIVKFASPIEPTVAEGIVDTGIPEVDALNQQYGVYEFEQLFPEPDVDSFNSNDGRWSFDDFYDSWYNRGLGNGYVFKFDTAHNASSVAGVYNAIDATEYAEVNGLSYACYTPDDDEFYAQCYLDDQWDYSLQAESAWDNERGNPKFIAAVLDSGVWLTHVDLRNRLTHYSLWWDFVDDDDRPMDNLYDDDHGTAVAGIIGAETDNSECVAGIDWEVRILPIRIAYWDEDRRKNVAPWGLMASGVAYAVNKGADVINISYGGNDGNGFLENVIEAAYYDNGRLIVASAGNLVSSILYPARYSEVIAVGGIRYDNGYRAYEYRATGDQQELMAPYVSHNVRAGDAYVDEPNSPENKRTGSFFGTSASAPMVAGVATLIWAQHESWDNLKVRKKLQGSTKKPPGYDEAWDQWYGFGDINAYYAVKPIVWGGDDGAFTSDDADVKLESTKAAVENADGAERTSPGFRPNPVRDTTVLSFSTDTGYYAVTVYDITGRTVKAWEGTACGDVDLSWDLTEENGSPLGSGVYMAEISDGVNENFIKAVVTR
jgi:subtilisin family serine protease